MSAGQRKNLSYQQELNLQPVWPSVNQSDALTTEVQSTCGKLGHVQGSNMIGVLRTARISSV